MQHVKPVQFLEALRAWPVFRSGLGIMLSCCLAVLLGACRFNANEPEEIAFVQDGESVRVEFLGEVSDRELFGPHRSVLDFVHPRDDSGMPTGELIEERPGWLAFRYQVGDITREVLLARRPILNFVSWIQIAQGHHYRRGESAPLNDGVLSAVGADLALANGESYRVRLPECGTRTMANLSEWNLLLGGVHAGDMDFRGVQYGWIESPYNDAELGVGYRGYLTWCADEWRSARVARGYFNVSRFHASDPDAVTDRLAWRPVLERIVPVGDAAEWSDHSVGTLHDPGAQASPDGMLIFHGLLKYHELFDEDFFLDDHFGLEAGFRFHLGRPDWLEFSWQDSRLLVARWPVRTHLSWNDLARLGLVGGDDGWIWLRGWPYRQDETVFDGRGREFRVRLLDCGTRTLDHDSEWNRLIGALHKGDEDFLASAMPGYAWVTPLMNDMDLNVGTRHGGTTWCRNVIDRAGRRHAVNRGYHVVSRFHATESSYTGSGFAWRPVLELVQ